MQPKLMTCRWTSWWLVGVVLQIGAGLIGRILLAKVAGLSFRPFGELT
jgi:hypothetical protein